MSSERAKVLYSMTSEGYLALDSDPEQRLLFWFHRSCLENPLQHYNLSIPSRRLCFTPLRPSPSLGLVYGHITSRPFVRSSVSRPYLSRAQQYENPVGSHFQAPEVDRDASFVGGQLSAFSPSQSPYQYHPPASPVSAEQASSVCSVPANPGTLEVLHHRVSSVHSRDATLVYDNRQPAPPLPTQARR